MPTYLLHGFRWHRPNIRIHIIVNDLEDAAPEWIIAPTTSSAILHSLYALYDFLPPSNPPPDSYPLPAATVAADGETEDDDEDDGAFGLSAPAPKPYRGAAQGRKGRPSRLDSTTLSKGAAGVNGDGVKRVARKKIPSFNDWSVVKFLEQYDPMDLQVVSQPWAYVADYVVEVGLGVGVAEEMVKYEAMRSEDGGTMGEPETPATPETPVSDSKDEELENHTEDMVKKTAQLGWFGKLRDSLQPGEEIGWYVVVCGDEVRASPMFGRRMQNLRLGSDDDLSLKSPRSAGLRGFFNRKKIISEEY